MSNIQTKNDNAYAKYRKYFSMEHEDEPMSAAQRKEFARLIKRFGKHGWTSKGSVA